MATNILKYLSAVCWCNRAVSSRPFFCRLYVVRILVCAVECKASINFCLYGGFYSHSCRPQSLICFGLTSIVPRQQQSFELGLNIILDILGYQKRLVNCTKRCYNFTIISYGMEVFKWLYELPFSLLFWLKRKCQIILFLCYKIVLEFLSTY